MTRPVSTLRVVPALACALVLAAALPAAAQQPDLGPTLTKIRTAKQIVLGYRETSLPFSYTNEAKEPSGYTVDVCKAVVASLQEQLKLQSLPIKWVPVTVEGRFRAVASGSVDLECGASTITLSRMATVDFSAPVFVEGGSVLVRADGGVRRIADLAGKRIGVGESTTADTALREYLRNRLVNAEIVTVKSSEDALVQLDAGKLDGYANDRVLLIGAVVKDRDPKQYRMTDDDYSYEPYGIVMRRNDTAMRAAVNRALAQLYKGRGIVDIYAKWFGNFGAPGPLLQSMYYLNSLPE
jgi:ABC-type amino acid transport substrate-binding protein